MREVVMTQRKWKGFVVAVLAAGAAAGSVGAQATDPTCKSIHADLAESRSTTGCKPGHAVCFLGEVDGNHGLRGATYFRGDSSAAGPSTGLAGFVSYSGVFEYTTDRGTLVARETGVTNPSTGLPQSGAVTAYQQIQDATGEFAGATGFFFVSGRSANGHVVTQVTGEICMP
jgi:hypothetical protein